MWNYNCVANLLHIMLKAPHLKGEKGRFALRAIFEITGAAKKNY